MWNGKACWKTNGGDIAGPAYIYWRPKGGWFLGARLIKPTADDWSGTKAWLESGPGGFSNLHCPCWSENPSKWRCISYTTLKDEKIHELYMEVDTKVSQIEELQAQLLETKIQLDTATSILQDQWDPMHADGPSSSDAKFLQPTPKPAASRPSDDSQAGGSFLSMFMGKHLIINV